MSHMGHRSILLFLILHYRMMLLCCSAAFVAILAVTFGQRLPACDVCTCKRLPRGHLVDCSHRNLTDIPANITSDTIVLDLSHNNITILPDDSFVQLVVLEKLNLSHNFMVNLEIKAFQGLRRLILLNLGSNALLLTNITFPPALFAPLENLRELYLDNNIVNDNSTYLGETVGQCLNLEVLYIPGIPYQTFGPAYDKLRKLTNLTLSTNDCNIISVHNETFNHTKYLKMLKLAACNITFIDMCSFCPLFQLDFLNLSYNSPDGLNLIRNVTYGLQYTKITNVQFTNMESPYEAGKTITKWDLEFSNRTTVKILNVSSNMIETLEAGSLDLFPPTLEEVDVSDNRPIFGPFLIELFKLKSLRIFRANYLNTYHPFKVFSIETLSRSSRAVTTYEKTGILDSSSPFPIPIPPKLEEIYCCHSMIPYNIPEIIINPDNSLRHLELNNNALNRWKGPLRNFNKLKYLDISVNFCDRISDKFFIYMTSLTSLRVRSNFIGYAIEQNLSCPWLKPLKNLVTLDLYLNKIRVIPPECFSTLVNLETLNLKENSISDWEVEIGHMPNISLIDLSGNNIDCFPVATTDHLSEVATRRNVTIDLTGNKLECTCENIEFLEWFDTANIIFVNKENYTCRDGRLKKIPMTDVKQIITDLKKRCADYTYLNTVLSVLIGGFILVILYGIYYRYKWKLSYFYYTTFGRYQLLQDDDGRSYRYDAYVSYSEDDIRFAEGELAPKLEGLHGLSLYLFERDCRGGRNIHANIVNNIVESRKIIVLFTRSYVKNPRCLFELLMASNMERMSKQESGTNIYLVKLDSVQHKDIPFSILKLFHSDSYIEYPRDPQGNNIFWERLKQSIKPGTDV